MILECGSNGDRKVPWLPPSPVPKLASDADSELYELQT